MVLQIENAGKKKSPLEIYRRIYFVSDGGISGKYFLTLGADGLYASVKASVIMTLLVIISQLSVNCRWTLSVCEGVGDCGIFSKYFSTLGEMPTKTFRRWGFLKNYLE